MKQEPRVTPINKVTANERYGVPAVRGKDIPPLLYDLLSFASPHGYEDPIKKLLYSFFKSINIPNDSIVEDSAGNILVTVRDKDNKKSEVAFSCHMDTVHLNAEVITPFITKNSNNPSLDGYVFGRRTCHSEKFFCVLSGVEYTEKRINEIIREVNPKTFWYKWKETNTPNVWRLHLGANKSEVNDPTEYYAERKKGAASYTTSVLGADDKVGCYILCRLMAAKIPGLYMFHAGEEVGCVGSRHISSKTPEVLDGIKAVVAFDRMGYGDVISHQRGGRSSSSEFTKALAEELNGLTNTPTQQFSGDVRGVYTDSAVYVDLVGECTNLSVGYFQQHTQNEHFDMVWLDGVFIPALIHVKWDKLPFTRKAGEKEEFSYSSYGDYYYGGGKYKYKGNNRYSDNYYNKPTFNSFYDIQVSGELVMDWDHLKSSANEEEEDEDEDTKMLSSASFWDSLGYCPPWQLHNGVDPLFIPEWSPEFGVFPNTNKKQMKMIIDKHVKDNFFTEDGKVRISKVIQFITDMVMEK